MNTKKTKLDWEWKAAASGFVFAGLVGAWMRYAMSTGNWAGLELAHVRHAHSHVMLFVWATTGWMILLTELLGRLGAHIGGFRRLIHWSLGLGMASFIPFLFWGYKLAEIGPVRMPLSVIISTALMFVWYGFAWVWKKHRHIVSDQGTRLVLDIANFFMVVCTVGAWLRGLLVPLGVDDPVWTTGVVHMFLNTMTDGWLLVGLLGLMALSRNATLTTRFLPVMAAGIPLSFLAVIHGLPLELRVLGGFSSVFFVYGLLRTWWPLLKHASKFLALALLLMAAARLLYTVPDIMHWADRSGVRILFLHWVFLGVLSVGLWEVRDRLVGSRTASALAWTVPPLVLGILPATALWSVFASFLNLDALAFLRAGQVATVLTSFGPALVVFWALVHFKNSNQRRGHA